FINFVFVSVLIRLHSATLFPYTTLFRSAAKSLCDKSKIEINAPALVGSWFTSLRAARFVRSVSRHELRSAAVEQPAQRRYSSRLDRKSTRLNSSHQIISYAVFCLKK